MFDLFSKYVFNFFHLKIQQTKALKVWSHDLCDGPVHMPLISPMFYFLPLFYLFSFYCIIFIYSFLICTHNVGKSAIVIEITVPNKTLK